MDIVKRLREGKSAGGYWREKEAADEIERLREALQQIADKNPFHNQCPPINDLQYYAQVIVEMVTIANAALKENE
jgi:hypothetical protein